MSETLEGPTLWTMTTVDGEEKLNDIETKLTGSKETGEEEWDRAEESSLKRNQTLVNSTLNYTNEVKEFLTLLETIQCCSML